jgi:DNA-binding NarL/FixJ family response regulator
MSPIRILLADNHGVFLDITRRYLRQQSDLLVVDATTRGQEVLDLARHLAPQVVLIDLAMPDLPGLDAIAELRAQSPRIGIIALTLLDVDGYRQAALAAGADEFVAKSRMVTDLVPAIRRVARTRLTRTGPVTESPAAPPGGPAHP